jgi:hypothetical protein
MKIPRCAACVLSVLVVSCTTLQVAVDYNPDFDFGSIRSYAWLPHESPPGTDLRINNALINDRVVAAVDTRLEAKGYRKVDAGTPDIYVTWLGAIDRRIRVDTINDYYGSSWHGSYRCCWGSPRRTLVSEYEEGTLIIDVLNSVDRKLVWRGIGRDYIRTMQSPEETTRNIHAAVDGILADFPPGKP